MSSRKGNIITGDQLIEEVRARVGKVMECATENGKTEDPSVLERVAIAALKYSMLKSNVSQDVSFDMDESLAIAGDSGPYLLYIVARINSILKKAGTHAAAVTMPSALADEEKQLLLKLAQFPAATLEAATTFDPSKIAKYVFELAQKFTAFYEACPVLKAETEDLMAFRVATVRLVLQVAERALYLLGIDTVEEM